MTAMKVKQFSGIVVCLLFYFICFSQHVSNIIPLPNHIEFAKDSFTFSLCTQLRFNNKDTMLRNALNPLITKMKTAAGIDLLSTPACNKSRIAVVVD